ncbi:hypothetical protein PVK06_036351 [Gossypium arboreum]|uniref:Aminotransferase-like plant mobile domain-containing protein n=1 Tax=Gossypium arboreum TaxID=29729 RepID=A0ABR0NLI2_GOSAR|nr:hypothetical protein PVK06_036351 [Gossypium arboreum]
MSSLITAQDHTVRTIHLPIRECSNVGSYHVLRPCGHALSYRLDTRILPYLDATGFVSAILIRMFEVRGNLISALVERWRSETHTFQLPCGECTITLEDFAMQLGLLVDGDAVTDTSSIADPTTLYYYLLGRSPGDATLYRELCLATKHKTIDICGCPILLQSWALYRMSFLAPVGHQVHVFPLVNR